jgi:hypothetical protein
MEADQIAVQSALLSGSDVEAVLKNWEKISWAEQPQAGAADVVQ